MNAVTLLDSAIEVKYGLSLLPLLDLECGLGGNISFD